MVTQTDKRQAVIAVFKNWNEANQAKQTLEASGLEAPKISIDDNVSPYVQVGAQGTTTGGEAGLLLGAFYGGVLGVIAATIVSVWTTGGYVNSNSYRLLVIGLAIAGGIFGALVAKGIRQQQGVAQKMKSNPDIPRRFRLLVEGSVNDIQQAQQALGQPLGQG
jgi:hypothetical protein